MAEPITEKQIKYAKSLLRSAKKEEELSKPLEQLTKFEAMKLITYLKEKPEGPMDPIVAKLFSVPEEVFPDPDDEDLPF